MPVGIRYTPSIALDVLRLSQSGMTRSRIAEAVGTDKRTFKKWMARHPEVKKALDMGYGRDSRQPFAGGKATFADYCLTALPPELHALWRRLNDMDEQTGEKRFDAIMADKGDRVRQQIFLHSLISTNFNKFAAMRRACVTHNQVDRWKREDPDFLDLVNHVHEMKKDFIEGGLMALVAERDTSATIFAAKTLLQDRGYGTKVTVEHKGETTHRQIVLQKVLHKLDRKSKRMVLDQVRAVKALPPRVVQAGDA